MINEADILDAITECETEPITMAKINKLAALYTVHSHLFGEICERKAYSYAQDNEERQGIINVGDDTDFLKMINGKNAEKVFAVLGELMQTIEILHPRMYDDVCRRIAEI